MNGRSRSLMRLPAAPRMEVFVMTKQPDSERDVHVSTGPQAPADLLDPILCDPELCAEVLSKLNLRGLLPSSTSPSEEFARLGVPSDDVRCIPMGPQGHHHGLVEFHRHGEGIHYLPSSSVQPGSFPHKGLLDAIHANPVCYALVLLDGRPVLPVKDHKFSTGESAIWASRLAAGKSLIEAALPSVGGILIRTRTGRELIGTGWLLTEDTVVTNRHVAHVFSRSTSGPPWTGGSTAEIESVSLCLDERVTVPPQRELVVTQVRWIDEDTDLAFLRIQPDPTTPCKPLRLIATLPQHLEERYVVAVGYPQYSSAVLTHELQQVEASKRAEFTRVIKEMFEGKTGLKMVQPGQIQKVLRTSNGTVARLQHDCSTLGGNSGSVLLDIESGQVLGTHFGGMPLRSNYAVPASLIGRLARELNLL